MGRSMEDVRSSDGKGVGREVRTSRRMNFCARWTDPLGIPHLETHQQGPARGTGLSRKQIVETNPALFIVWPGPSHVGQWEVG